MVLCLTSFRETECHYVAEAGLEHIIFLPQPSQYWDDRREPTTSNLLQIMEVVDQ